MLSVHFFLSTVLLETCCSRIPELQNENVVEHCHPRTISGFRSVEPRIATTLKGRFVRTRGTHLQSDVIEESRIPKLCLQQSLHGKSRLAL